MRPPRRAGKETPASAKLTLIIGRVTSGARPPRVGYLGQTGPSGLSVSAIPHLIATPVIRKQCQLLRARAVNPRFLKSGFLQV